MSTMINAKQVLISTLSIHLSVIMTCVVLTSTYIILRITLIMQCLHKLSSILNVNMYKTIEIKYSQFNKNYEKKFTKINSIRY